MTVYELLHKTSVSRIKEHLLEINQNDENRRGDVESFLEMILALEQVETSNFVITETYECDKVKDYFYYAEIYAFDPVDSEKHIELYTLPLEKVLGCSVDEECLLTIDQAVFMADVLDEFI